MSNPKATGRSPIAVPFNPSDEKKRGIIYAWTLGHMLQRKVPERAYLLRPWFRSETSAMLYAPSGVGKSFFAQAIALAVASGTPLGEWRPDNPGRPWRVGYMDGEMHFDDATERLQRFVAGMPKEAQDRARQAAESLFYLPRQAQPRDAVYPSITREEAEGLVEVAERLKLDLLVLDNFSTLGSVDDENSAASFDELNNFLLKLKSRGIASLLVHHTTKEGKTFRGSNKLEATFENTLEMRPTRYAVEIDGGADVEVELKKKRSMKSALAIRARLEEVPSPSSEALSEALAEVRLHRHQEALLPGLRWNFEELVQDQLRDVRERLARGEVKSQEELAKIYSVDASTISKWKRQGEKLGLWTDAWWRNGVSRTGGRKGRPKGAPRKLQEVLKEDF